MNLNKSKILINTTNTDLHI